MTQQQINREITFNVYLALTLSSSIEEFVVSVNQCLLQVVIL